MRVVSMVLAAIAVSVTVALAADNQLFLDYNRDGDLWTIEDRSLADVDTVTLILEFREVPPNFRFQLTYETDCGVVTYGDDSQYVLSARIAWSDEVGCNEEIVTDCEWQPQVCNHDCSCYNPAINMRMYDDQPIFPNRRYELAKFVITRGSHGTEGRIRVVSLPWSGDELASNDVWIGSTVSPVEQTTWGTVKSRFRDRNPPGN